MKNNSTRFFCLMLLWAVVFFAAAPALSAEKAEIPVVPVPATVTMVDLGAASCIPCKMMAPILAELAKEYSGRAAIIFIDVWQHRDVAKKFAITAIPTQIFYDSSGAEVWRHTGFLDKESITKKIDELLN